MINFHSLVSGFALSGKREIKKWLTNVITDHGKSLGQIDFIFCSDEYILEINREHLNHDYYTDVITFDYSEEEKLSSGDIFISIDSVSENAKECNIAIRDELERVMVHGVLHLLGYVDGTEEEKQLMRSKEDHYLIKLAH
jgi:probable rRNA maturation factor